MGLLGKLTKRGAQDDDDDDDDDGQDPQDEGESEDSESDSGGAKSGLMSRMRGLRKRKGSDDGGGNRDPKEVLDAKKKASGGDAGQEDDAEDGAADGEDLPDVQVVRLEGVQDVRVVGDPAAGGGQDAANGGSSPAPAAASAGEAANDKDKAGGDAAEGSGLSLKDIFEEEVEVDEVLKDLAESTEDVVAQELADDLKEFFDELESSMK